jgi:hypothetical protein
MVSGWGRAYRLSRQCCSFHRLEQGLVRPPLRLFRLRPEDEPEDQVLRVRLEAGVQEVLRQVSGRVAAQVEEATRSDAAEEVSDAHLSKRWVQWDTCA